MHAREVHAREVQAGCPYDEQAAGTDWSNLLVENYLPAELANVWPAEWSNLI